jgi:hypothetical protein
MRIVNLDGAATAESTGAELRAAARAAPEAGAVLVGLARGAPAAWTARLVEALDLTLVPDDSEAAARRCCIGVPNPTRAAAALVESVASAPVAALTLAGLLRLTERLSVPDGLVAESLAYSMLLGGREFAAWRGRTPRHPPGEEPDEPVLVSRAGSLLRVQLNRPHRRNAYNHRVRNGLVEALQLAEHETSLTVELSGRGLSFCSGGDLDEFGTTPDVAAAHLIRLRRSAGAAVHRCASRIRALLHGACIGAGIEVPAFAGHVAAREDAWFQLPELAMGLIPGAGGTVSLPRRIGRWRTAYLALSGHTVEVTTALRWGLVDAPTS